MGSVVASLAKHHERPFHAIEGIEWPFMILFFFLAGASLDLDHDWGFGLIVAGYLILRTASRVLGGWLGARFVAAPDGYRRWIGIALLPQRSPGPANGTRSQRFSRCAGLGKHVKW